MKAYLLFFSYCLFTGICLAEFEKKQLEPRFFCEGVSVGDINRDGHPDVISGPYWYAAPSFASRATEGIPSEALAKVGYRLLSPLSGLPSEHLQCGPCGGHRQEVPGKAGGVPQ